MTNNINVELIKAKLSGLRVSDMKEVLLKLGMSRSGNKPELAKRILDFFTDASVLLSQSHRLADENRFLTATKALDAVYDTLVDGSHVHWHIQQRVKQLEKQQQAEGAGRSTSSATAGAGAAAQPAKRPRIDSSSAVAAGTEIVDDVVEAFLNGNEGLGPQNTVVRCICGLTHSKEPLLQCEGTFCGVWQHAACVKQLDSSTDLAALPADVQRQLTSCKQRQHYFCERCRVARADPFWELFDATVMAPAITLPTLRTVEHLTQTNPPQPKTLTVCKTRTMRFSLSSRQLMMLRAKPQEYQLQALSLQLDDEVQFRFNRPVLSAITCHQDGCCKPVPVRMSTRGIAVKMGPMQRDEPFNMVDFLPPGPRETASNMILEYEHCDASHSYVLLVYLMRRRSRELVKGLMKPPESLAAAMQRVQQQMRGTYGGGSAAAATAHAAATAAVTAASTSGTAAAAAAASSDDDEDDIVVGNSVVSLKDPNSGTRMVHAARFTDTGGVLPCAFDLDVFLELAQRTRKWIDPHSSKPSTVQKLQSDSYLTHIIQCLAALPDVTEVEINPEGLWRPNGSDVPFMSVLDDDQAGVVAAAAAGGGARPRTAAAAVSDGDEESDIDEVAEMEELRRAAAKLAQERAERAAAEAEQQKRQAKPGVEVIELLSDSDDDEPMQQQQEQQQQQRQGGIVIILPQRVPSQQQQLQQVQQQQQQQQQQLPLNATHGSAAHATAATAAAAVGPPVPHVTGGPLSGGYVESSSSRGTRVEGTLAAAVGGSAEFAQQVMQPLQQQQQQQQQQQPLPPSMPGQQLQLPLYQQQQVSGAVMLQQQLQPGSGFVVQGSGGMLLPQGSVAMVTTAMPMQLSGPVSGGMPPPAVTQFLAQQQQQQQNQPQPGMQQMSAQQPGPPYSFDQQMTLLPGQQMLTQHLQGRGMQQPAFLQANCSGQQTPHQQGGAIVGVSYQMSAPSLPMSSLPYQQHQQQPPLLGSGGQLSGMDSGSWQQQRPGYDQGGIVFQQPVQPQYQQQQGPVGYTSSGNTQHVAAYQHQQQGFAGYAGGRS